MAGRLAGKVAVVTGGCSGIGLATVRRFAEEGAMVVIGDLNDALGAQVAQEVAGTYVHTDVASKEDVDRLFKTAVDTYGKLDIAFWQQLREEGQPPFVDHEVPEERALRDTDPVGDRLKTTRSSTPTSTPGAGSKRSTSPRSICAARRRCRTCSRRSRDRSSTRPPSSR